MKKFCLSLAAGTFILSFGVINTSLISSVRADYQYEEKKKEKKMETTDEGKDVKKKKETTKIDKDGEEKKTEKKVEKSY